ncbi:MAG: hypothetical protein HFE90_02535 [Firmicutes bacterium]|nr:hypothetical protein [Bacillota bacterium]
MNIERKYYAQAQETIKNIEESTKKHNASLTEKERIEESRKIQLELEKFINRYNEKMKNAPEPVLDREKIIYFHEISRQALRMAKQIQADIKISTEDRIRGEITLKTDFILLDSDYPAYPRIILCNLLMSADQIHVSASDNLTEFNFYFDLCI